MVEPCWEWGHPDVQVSWGHGQSPQYCAGDFKFKLENGVTRREVEFQLWVMFGVCPLAALSMSQCLGNKTSRLG